MSYLENAPEQAWQHLVDARAHLSYAETSVALREFDWACFNAQLAGKKALHASWLNRGHEPRGHILASLIEEFPDEVTREQLMSTMPTARILDGFRISARYPSTPAYGEEDARRAIEAARELIRKAAEMMESGP
jgi:HEPN domain-containing protein